MGQQTGRNTAVVFIDDRVFVGAIVGGLVVFKAEVGDVIAQRVQEVIVAVVVSSEKSGGFFHQVPILVGDFIGDAGGALAVGGDMEIVFDGIVGAEIDSLIEGAHLHRRIDDRGERGGLEDDGVAGFALDGKSCSVTPAARNFERRLHLDLVAGCAFRVKQHLVPAENAKL